MAIEDLQNEINELKDATTEVEFACNLLRGLFQHIEKEPDPQLSVLMQIIDRMRVLIDKADNALNTGDANVALDYVNQTYILIIGCKLILSTRKQKDFGL